MNQSSDCREKRAERRTQGHLCQGNAGCLWGFGKRDRALARTGSVASEGPAIVAILQCQDAVAALPAQRPAVAETIALHVAPDPPEPRAIAVGARHGVAETLQHGVGRERRPPKHDFPAVISVESLASCPAALAGWRKMNSLLSRREIILADGASDHGR